jgi:hypothetical protein
METTAQAIQFYRVIQMGGNKYSNNNTFTKIRLQIDTDNIIIGNNFSVYKVSNRVFQIGEIDYDIKYINTIINVLDRGFKFIPCFHFNNFHIFKNLVLSIEKEMFNFNRQIFFKKVSLEKSIVSDHSIQVTLDASECSQNTPCDSLDCIFSKFKKKRNFSNLAYQEDSTLFELELLKQLENLDIKIHYNISLEELKIIKHFSKNKPFKIVELDKNVGAGIISNQLYLELANKIFEDSNTYTKLDTSPLDDSKEIIYDILMNLYEKNDISKKLFELLKPNFGNLGVASLLFKVHKEKFGIRQIISYKNHITSPMSILVDGILYPFVKKCDSFLLDSLNLIQKSENIKLNGNSKLVTADVVNLYSSIDQKECLKRITNFIKDDFKSKHLTVRGFKHILNIILNFNLFKFNGLFYKQILGIAMGSKCGPSIANIFVHTYEKSWLIQNKPLLYARFIDDIFMVVETLDILFDFSNAFGSLKLTISTGEKVQFLDLSISINFINLSLKFEAFFKKTNTFSYLLDSSNHPNFIFKNLPKSLFIRLRRNCSLFSDFIKYSEIITSQLVDRGYSLLHINKVFNMVSFLDRKNLLQYRERKVKNFSNCIFFKNIFDKSIDNINQLYKNSFRNVIKENELFKDVNIFIINKMQPNLKMILIHDFKIPIIYKNFFKKCEKENCVTCFYADTSYYIKLTEKFFLPIFDNSNCSTENCIYFLYCKFCDGFYVGQTNNFKKRFSNHRHNIKNFVAFRDPFCCVATHFNLRGHFAPLHLKFFIIKKDISWKEYRLSLESFFINLCKKLGVKLINDFIPSIKTLVKC